MPNIDALLQKIIDSLLATGPMGLSLIVTLILLMISVKANLDQFKIYRAAQEQRVSELIKTIEATALQAAMIRETAITVKKLLERIDVLIHLIRRETDGVPNEMDE